MTVRKEILTYVLPLPSDAGDEILIFNHGAQPILVVPPFGAKLKLEPSERATYPVFPGEEPI